MTIYVKPHSIYRLDQTRKTQSAVSIQPTTEPRPRSKRSSFVSFTPAVWRSIPSFLSLFCCSVLISSVDVLGSGEGAVEFGVAFVGADPLLIVLGSEICVFGFGFLKTLTSLFSQFNRFFFLFFAMRNLLDLISFSYKISMFLLLTRVSM
ncbi:hypothetical protein B296_00022016 [Ensete ventricosum]|uniref:Transmembrane protein n=1 Tax=Ensete ventricosum TaxID=4639 RepID=A0A426ZVQ5_ENSVE|nr:hypothetical protein B296_00022016 [Ensete ventricosum]